MITGFLNLPWLVWTGLALIVSAIYSFVWPKKAVTKTTGLRYFIVRWGHALVWVLLATNFLLRGISPSLNSAADVVALAGAAMYAAFLAMTFLVKKSARD